MESTRVCYDVKDKYCEFDSRLLWETFDEDHVT
jgi:hypothetical protein